MSEAKPRALVLAERIHPQTDWYEFDSQSWCNEAAAELRRQHEAIVALSEALSRCKFDSLNMSLADLQFIRETYAKHGVKQ
jgi:hypothetical protein